MSLIVRDPWKLMDQWRKETDSPFLSPMLHGEAASAAGSDWVPAVDIKEEEGRYLLHADIPGVKPEDIEVTLDSGVLTIRGERKHESTESEEGYRRLERSHGVFMRRFTLPDSIDVEHIVASQKDGVLEVSIPKGGTSQPKRIEVK